LFLLDEYTANEGRGFPSAGKEYPNVEHGVSDFSLRNDEQEEEQRQRHRREKEGLKGVEDRG
jgi:hypothetical protein